ncbi:hypothetical protein DDQ68_01170 [Hymenobacter nivis]|uniref:Transposase IS701-like DDE domain-containing protein n=1 Tax=Hymenobacter nivis TaxID=1850093 RepID=A0A2Z3GFC9_9BACT|nr:hypothetical protein DDQ68_01170 [Hymenobacter nivis]
MGGGDAAYGNSPALRQALESRQQAYVLDVGPNLGLHGSDPTPAAPPASTRRGRPARRLQPTLTAQLLPAWATQVPASSWRRGATRTGRDAKAPCNARQCCCPSGAGSPLSSRRRHYSC